ncbi:MAG: pilus assembly protein N-terminal domain-containing protein [Gammaproteobacteria bacterium]|nr:pilus assembly protein N-terminal domain-containing protein [Gammaproteobacteria bacterium]MDE0440574.1 pilus assembly protein N-terminal domain-containing protein [Gammaproteobacteria bacterium]
MNATTPKRPAGPRCSLRAAARFAAWLLAGACAHPTAAAETTLDLVPGDSRTLEFDEDVGTAFIADPATADVEALDNRTLFVLGRAEGITALEVRDPAGKPIAAYRIRVAAQPAPAREVVEHIAGAGAAIEVRPVGNTLIVSGRAKSPAEAEQVLRGIRAVAGDTPVVDALGLAGSTQVNLEVLISEVSRNVTQTLGIDWSIDLNPFELPLRTWLTGRGVRAATGAMSLDNVLEQVVQFFTLGPDGQPSETPQFSNEVNELGVVNPARGGDGGIVLAHAEIIESGKYRATGFLEALADNGLAVIHARPNLTTVSGQPAQFFSGIEIPVPTVSDLGNVGTEYRQTGVSLDFTPTVLDEGQISLTVEPRIREVAAGGATIAGTLVPNINERSASTTVELADGESIAIAGLYRRTRTSTSAGIPLLKDIPLWGALFHNATERDQSVELIIVVTPRIVAGVPPARPQKGVADAPGATARQLANEFYL